MFSLSAPTQPAKPRVKVTPPTARTNHTGSKPCIRVTWVRSSRTPFEQNRRVRMGEEDEWTRSCDQGLQTHLLTPCPESHRNEGSASQLQHRVPQTLVRSVKDILV